MRDKQPRDKDRSIGMTIATISCGSVVKDVIG